MWNNQRVLTAALAMCMMLAVTAVAIETPRYRYGDKNRADGVITAPTGAERVNWLSEDRQVLGRPVTVGAFPSASPGLQVGATTFDQQHNASTGRQVDVRGIAIQTTFMFSDQFSTTLGRKVRWNKAYVVGGVQSRILDNGGSVRYVPLGQVGSSDGVDIISEGNRPGYTTFRNLPTGRGVVFAHDAPEPPATGAFWFAGVDNAIAVGVFSKTDAPQPDSQAAGDEVIWPHGCTDVVGSDTVLHVVGTQSGDLLTDFPIYYWRGVVANGGTAITWSTPYHLDTVSITSVIVEADPTSDDVAIVYTKPRRSGTQIDNDVVYRLSTDGGLSWSGVINVTNYEESSFDRAYVDLDAVFDDDGTLHIVWPTLDYRPNDGTYWQPVDMCHWNEVRMTERVISTSTWTNTCDQVTGGFRGGVFNLLYAKPNIAVKPAGAYGVADELLYVVWVQFGPTEVDCATRDSSGTPGGQVNGELWCSVSSDDGLTWDRPVNITGTVTPDCLPGDCSSEHWVSAAARADSGVYLSYVEDTHAGIGIRNDPQEGKWSISPYRLYAIESRLPVPEPRVRVVPTRMLELNAAPSGENDTLIEVRNLGNDTLYYTAVVTNDDDGGSHVLVEDMLSYSGKIPPGGKPDTLTVRFNGVGLANRTIHNWRIELTCNDTVASPVDITLNVFIADPWFACSAETLSTGLHRLAVSSCLKMGEQVRLHGGMYRFADSTAWLYSASPIIVKRDLSGHHRHVYRDLFFSSIEQRSRDSNRAFRAQSAITMVTDTVLGIKDTAYSGSVARGLASSTDSTLLIDWEVRMFNSLDAPAELACGAVGLYTVRPGPVNDFLFGFLELGAGFDPDIDSSLEANVGMASDTSQLLCGQGGYFETDTGDSIFCPQTRYIALFYVPTDTSCSGLAGGGQFLDNRVYVSYDRRGRFDDDSLYNWMTHNLIGWNNATFPEDSLTDGATDVCGLIKDRTVPWTGSETYRFGFGVAVSDISEQDLEDQVRMLRHAANPACAPLCAVMMTGDVNLSSTITSADIIATVNYVFKGGTMPQPCEAAGDATCDAKVTSADIIYLVNHVFKGGDPPCNGCGTTLGWGC